ncbi:MAG: transposase family protein, partial [Boseongicola sp.]|nr:transposase family protein [Boseongicola sp.]
RASQRLQLAGQGNRFWKFLCLLIHTAASDQIRGCAMQEILSLFQGVVDPRRSNATRHSLHEMLVIALLPVLCGGESRADMERFGRSKEVFLRRFMVLKHGIPSHDAFSDLFNARPGQPADGDAAASGRLGDGAGRRCDRH